MANLHTVLGNLDKKLCYTEGHSIAIHLGLDLAYTTGSGKARIGPDVKMTSLIRMDVLSMSKTITAAGVVRQLLAMGLTPKEKIGPHLPKFWSIDPQVAALTFAHVLTHSGGLLGDQSDFNQVQALCAAKPAGTIGQVNYQNINYSLLRVLLAYLDSGDTLDQLGQLWFGRPLLSTLSAGYYMANIENNILAPSGVTAATIGPESPESDQAEWFTDNKDHLGDQHDPTNALVTAGADRWNMNVREYGRFIAHLTNGRLQPDPWPTMRDTRAPGAPAMLPAYAVGDARLGVWRFQAPDGSGNYYGHNGGWSDAFTGWMAFECGANVVFFADSTLNGDEQEKMILDSWLAA
jgi:CubicO group peptidase (beta-lactamase class C family)